MSINAIEALSEFCATLRYGDLPSEVVDQAKRFLLDAVGCAYAAYKEDPKKAAIAAKIAASFGPGSALVINGEMTHPAAAGLANGILINAADNDDTHKRALVHIGSVVVPAALSAALANRADARDFLVSLVVGYEVTARVGMSVMPTHYRFWHSTATNGTFGAAAAAARAWQMTPEQMRIALGFAGTQAAGLNTFFESGDDSKSVHPGKAAMNGVLAAMLTDFGATAPPDIFGHPKGYLAAYSLEPKPEILGAGLGRDWEILQNGFKFYPSILASHSPIGATLEILSKKRVNPADVKSVEVRTYATVKSHFSSRDICNSMAARLSVPYCVAAALVDGEITQRQFSSNRFTDSTIGDMLQKVEIVADSELSLLYPEKFPARVIVELCNGQIYEATHMYPKGDPQNPLTEEELLDKFRNNLDGVVSSAHCESMLSLIGNLENIELEDLVKVLAKHGAQ